MGGGVELDEAEKENIRIKMAQESALVFSQLSLMCIEFFKNNPGDFDTFYNSICEEVKRLRHRGWIRDPKMLQLHQALPISMVMKSKMIEGCDWGGKLKNK